MNILHSILGLLALTALAWLISENRKAVPLKTVCAGLAVQLLLALLLLKLPWCKDFFLLLNQGVSALQTATDAGTSFVFGYLGGGDLPFAENFPGASFILAFRALPLILVVSALSSLLFYWRIMPMIVKGFSWTLQKTLSIGGALGVGAAANIFVGMIEAPLFIRPYLSKLTRSELFAVMTCGMATIAGTVMVLYASILDKVIPGAMGHILVASIISAPAALTVARIMIPETNTLTAGDVVPAQNATSSMDAVTKGTADGLHFLINITAMLIVLVALVHLANIILGLAPDLAGKPITLQRMVGLIMAPVVWLMGIPWAEAKIAGVLMGTKTVMNELLAYLELARLPENTLSPRSMMIMTYAMCGFANLGSLGIMIGGLGSMAPERKNEVVSLGIRSIISGTLATMMTGAIAGIFYF
ncbi:MAG: nucleoside:proton symporter [Proteobacteria bacterium]|nr:nucleoside:proton symporter [Pseudomonadota bacterium]MBU1709583.1 nucleoside:proton symporter [Pseudomonadota bacterium]